MLEFVYVLLFIGIVCGAYEAVWWYRRCKYRKEFTHMIEDELWQEKDRLNAQLQKYFDGLKKRSLSPRKLVEKRGCLFAELERRDLSACSPQDEESYRIRLLGLLNILVYKEFMDQWDKLSKDNEHPRRTAVYYALAREELLNRYHKQCADLPEDKLTAEYKELSHKLEQDKISRGSYVRFLAVREEMAKRKLFV